MGEPRLRFKADDGSEFPAWEEKTFWDVFANLTNNTLSRECLNAESGQARNIHYGDVLVKYGVVVDVQRDGVPFVNPDVECKRWDCLKNGDVVIADTAEDETVGKAVEISNAGSDIVYSGLHTIACRPKEEFAPGYLGNYINSMSYHDQLRPYMQGIKVASVSKTNIGLTHLLVPSLPEQRKIADLLSAVDAVTAAQQAEVDAWEQRKKGVMQKLFSQEVRFKADDGSDFPAWEEKTLGEVCFINPRTDALEDEFYYMDLGCVDRGMWEKPEVVSKKNAPNRAQRVAQIGDVFFQSVRPYNMGHYHYTNKMDKQVVASTGYIQARMKNGCNAFLYQMFYEERFNVEVSMRCTGSNYPAITANKFSEIVTPFPSLPEQRKIADCLSSIDDVIAKAKAELTKWQELKKGLLQQMFV